MKDNSSYTKAEAKIHILYLVDKVPGVSYHMLMDSCMKSLYVDFFDFADAYEELISGNLMNKSASQPGSEDALGSTEILTITEGGRAVLSDLIGAMNNNLVGVLDQIAQELKKEQEESKKITGYKAFTGSGYEVTLTSEADDISTKIKICCDSEEQADLIIRNWRRDSGNITKSITDQLSNS